MKRTLLLAAALAAVPLTAALAQRRAPPAGLTPEQIVAARQSGYLLSGGSFAAMKAAAEAGADVKQLAFPSRTLARWARTLPSLFPAGTNLPASKALPTVWSDRNAFLARWAETRATCAACHDTYRRSD
jgi:cytochrome c556